MISKDWKKQDDWYWEGNVQARVASYLRDQGYQVSTVDTLKKERGPDIIAVKGEERILFEVKGWPSDKYAEGIKAGQKKRTNPNTQAPHWFSQALFTLIEAKNNFPDCSFILVLPDFPRYQTLAERSKAAFETLGFQIWFVNESGEVVIPSKPRDENQKSELSISNSSIPLATKLKSETCDLFHNSLRLFLTFSHPDGSVFFMNQVRQSKQKNIWQEWAYQNKSPYKLQYVENPTPEGERVRQRFYTALKPSQYQTSLLRK